MTTSVVFKLCIQNYEYGKTDKQLHTYAKSLKQMFPNKLRKGKSK